MELENIEVLQKVITLARKKNLLTHPDNSTYIEYVRDRAFNDLRYHIDWRGLQALGWKRQWEFDAALEETMDWYLELPANYWPNMETALQAHPQFAIQPATDSPTSASTNDSINRHAADGHVTPAHSPLSHNPTSPLSDLPLPTTRLSRAFSVPTNPWQVNGTCSREHRIGSGADCSSTPSRWLIYNSQSWLATHFVNHLSQLRPMDVITHPPAPTKQHGHHATSSSTSSSVDQIDRLKHQISDSHANYVVYFLPDHQPTDSLVHTLHHRSFLPAAIGRVCRELHLQAMIVTNDSLASDNSTNVIDLTSIDTHTTEVLTLLRDTTLHVHLGCCIADDDDKHNNFIHTANKSANNNDDNNNVRVSVLADALPIAINLFTKNEVGTVYLNNPEPITASRVKQLFEEVVENRSASPSQKRSLNGVLHPSVNTNQQQWSTHGAQLPATETSIIEVLRQYQINQTRKKVETHHYTNGQLRQH